jgi:hypothetical protein
MDYFHNFNTSIKDIKSLEKRKESAVRWLSFDKGHAPLFER